MVDDHPPQSAGSPDPSDEIEFRLSADFDGRGSRILVRGKPGAMEEMTKRRSAQSRDMATCRVIGHLERYAAGVWELLDKPSRDNLVHLILSLCSQSVRERDAYVQEVLAGTMKFVPTLECVPDPDAEPIVQRIPADGRGREDPEPLESVPHDIPKPTPPREGPSGQGSIPPVVVRGGRDDEDQDGAGAG